MANCVFRDNLLSVRIGQLHIVPGQHRTGIIFCPEPVPTGDPLVEVEPMMQAVQYQIDTVSDPAFVVLRYSGQTQRIELIPGQSPIGPRYYFTIAGERSNKLYFLPGAGFVSRQSLGLQDRIRYLGHENARKLTRARIARKLQTKYYRRPAIKKQLELEARLERLNRELQ